MKSLSPSILALLAGIMTACTPFSQQQVTDTPETPVATKQEEKAETTNSATKTETPNTSVPTEATVTAVETTGASGIERGLVTEALLPTTPVIETEESPTTIPGRSGLRLGRFAPPEEATSSSEQAAPTPNAAELRGLRSPSLPTKLPLDVNGQRQQN